MQSTLPDKPLEVKPGVVWPDADALGQALGKPGLYLDAHAADPIRAVEAALTTFARRTLILVDSHKEAQRVERRFRTQADRDGNALDARAYPKRSLRDEGHRDGNCTNFAEVEDAEAAGLAPGMAVCPACDDRKACRFYRQQERAELAQHAIATEARAGADFLGMTETRDAVFIVSDRAASFFRPATMATASASDVRATLATVAEAAREAGYKAWGDLPFWRNLRALADQLATRIAEAPDRPGEGFVVAPEREGEPPPAWAASLWAAVKQLPPRPRRDVVRLVTGAAVGRLGELFGSRHGDAVELVAAGKLPVPDKPVIVLGYESAADLSRATDRIVHALGGPQPLAVPVWQAAVHMTAQARPKAAADLIRGFAGAVGVGLIGVLMHRKASDDVVQELAPLVNGPTPPRLVIGHWWGDVRQLQNCDLILALGAPTIRPASVRLQLIQTGQADAAGQPGDWGPLPWHATTAAGETVLMPRHGYRNAAWQAVHAEAVATAVRRTLALIGRPAVLLTDECFSPHLPELSVIKAPNRLSHRDAKILTALQFASSVRGVRGGDTSESCTPKLLGDNVFIILAKMGFIPSKCHPITAGVIAALTDLRAKTVANRLTVLRDAGFVAWTRAEGWTLPTAAWSPVEAAGLPPSTSSTPPRDSKPAFDAAAEVLVDALVGLVAARGGRWEGPATALEAMLAGYARRNRVKPLRTWLGSADRIGRAVRRLEKQLAAAGVGMAVRRARGGVRMIVLKTVNVNRQQGEG